MWPLGYSWGNDNAAQLYNIGFPWGGYKEILDEMWQYWTSRMSHRVPIFPCILWKREIQHCHYYLDHPCEIMNFLYEQKSLKNDGTGIKFSMILVKYKPQSFTSAILEAHWGNNRIRVVTMRACAYISSCAQKLGVVFGSSCEHDCKQGSWRNNVQCFFTIKCA